MCHKKILEKLQNEKKGEECQQCQAYTLILANNKRNNTAQRVGDSTWKFTTQCTRYKSLEQLILGMTYYTMFN